MPRNDMKKKLQAGERIYGTMLQEMINPTAAQIFKRAGFGFFMIGGFVLVLWCSWSNFSS